MGWQLHAKARPDLQQGFPRLVPRMTFVGGWGGGRGRLEGYQVQKTRHVGESSVQMDVS